MPTKSTKRCERCDKPCETWYIEGTEFRFRCLTCIVLNGKPKQAKGQGKSEDKKWMFLDAWTKHAGDAPPPPETEYRFLKPLRDFRADFAYPDLRLLLEIDGGVQMRRTSKRTGKTMVGGRHNTDADREKMNLAAAYGWRVIRFSTQQLKKDPAGCVEVVKLALAQARKAVA